MVSAAQMRNKVDMTTAWLTPRLIGNPVPTWSPAGVHWPFGWGPRIAKEGEVSARPTPALARVSVAALVLALATVLPGVAAAQVEINPANGHH